MISPKFSTISKQLKLSPILKEHVTILASSSVIPLITCSWCIIFLQHVLLFLNNLSQRENKINHLSLDESLSIDNWPVQSSNELYLNALKSSQLHAINQLPAYDIKNKLIHPSEYEEKLAGAIARVCFSIIHYTIKQRHVYNAIVHDITILWPPTTIAPSYQTHILHPKTITD